MEGRDMTQGKIWKQLTAFALPLLLGLLLQLAYNAFDAIVVGNFVSSDALGSVGASGPLINIIVSFFMGMSSGSSVLISQYYGARDAKELRNTVHTSMLLSIILGAVLAVVGFFLAPAIMNLLKTPEDIFNDAVTYLRIFFIGMPALTVYNMGAAILTATGDSKRPLYFLILSSVINIAGNLIFVLVFHMGVAGVAWSTILSEIICAALVVLLLSRVPTGIRLNLKRLRIHKHILKRVLRLGLPSGIQGTIVSVSNAVVQGYINGLDVLLNGGVVAAYTSTSRLDAFITLPIQAMTMAVSTFVGQNLGAGQVKRARSGVKVAMCLGIPCSAVLSAAVLLSGSFALRMFSGDEMVLNYGVEFMRVLAPGHFILNFCQILPGALRGANDVNLSTFASVGSFVVLRQIYLFFVTKSNNSIFTVALGYPITWFIAAVIITVYYMRSNWSKFERSV
ncbi:MAG: MATE family efflux transporter [Clostridiales bacterium]|nr:MATE family efflux transporter [Clostridiales bacterium]